MSIKILKKDGANQPLLLRLSNKAQTYVDISSIGASITSIFFKDKTGQLIDVVLGYEEPEDYKTNTNTFFGATVGRNANRIEGAHFSINGTVHQLTANEGVNNLHSGPNGYQIRTWTVSEINEVNNKLILTLNSPDGDQGFPSQLEMTACFQLTESNQLIVRYSGISDAATIFNPTNHSYFNLNGHNSGSIEEHFLTIKASHFTPVKDSHSIPSGEVKEVKGTAFDFTSFKEVGQDINSTDEQLLFTGGYDHNWVLDDPSLSTISASLIGNKSKIRLDLATNLPGVQFYSGNFLDQEPGKNQATYPKRGGLCLETQYFPNAANTNNFLSPLMQANTLTEYVTIFKFSLVD